MALPEHPAWTNGPRQAGPVPRFTLAPSLVNSLEKMPKPEGPMDRLQLPVRHLGDVTRGLELENEAGIKAAVQGAMRADTALAVRQELMQVLHQARVPAEIRSELMRRALLLYLETSQVPESMRAIRAQNQLTKAGPFTIPLVKAFGQAAADHKYTRRTYLKGHWVYEYAEQHGGHVSSHQTDPDKVVVKVAPHHAQALEALAAKHGVPAALIHGSTYAMLPLTHAQADAVHHAESGGQPLPAGMEPLPKATHPEPTPAALAAIPPAKMGVVGSPAFRNWFGDWTAGQGSVVVNKDNVPEEQFGAKPQVVYHGTPVGGFTEFRKDKDKGTNIFGKGFYFTADKEIATAYTEKDADEALSAATGLKDSAGNPVTHLTKEQGALIVQHAGDNPNWSPNVIAAVRDATESDGRVNVATMISKFWRPTTVGEEVNYPGESYGHKTQEMANTYLPGKAGHIFMEGVQKHTGHTAVVAPSQVFEVYLNIRNPVDMDAVVSPDEFSQLAAFTHKKAVARAEQELARTLEQREKKRGEMEAAKKELATLPPLPPPPTMMVVPKGKKKAVPTPVTEWTNDLRWAARDPTHPDHGLAQAFSTWEQTQSHRVGLEQVATGKGYLGFEAMSQWVEREQKRLADLKAETPGTRIHGVEMDNVAPKGHALSSQDATAASLADFISVKQHFKGDRTEPKMVTVGNQTKPVGGVFYVGDQKPGTITWGELHWMMSNGHDSKRIRSDFDEWARGAGKDGVHHTGGWNIGGKPHSVWIAFEPNQIKAVTNSGAFDPASPDILKGGQAMQTFTLDLSKSEGDRGGHVVGHTASGKPIYETHAATPQSLNSVGQHKSPKVLEAETAHPAMSKHPEFTAQDHKDAAAHWDKRLKEHPAPAFSQYNLSAKDPGFQPRYVREKAWSPAQRAEVAEHSQKTGKMRAEKQAHEAAAGLLEKRAGLSKSEGDRGGHVIGHTSSGKPIYATATKLAFQRQAHAFSPQDHEDAASAHQRAAEQSQDPNTRGFHRNLSEAHDALSEAGQADAHSREYLRRVADSHSEIALHFARKRAGIPDAPQAPAAPSGGLMSRFFKSDGITFIIPADLTKAEPKGGKYHRRVTGEDGKHRYFYSAEAYAKSPGAHLSGPEIQAARIDREILEKVPAEGALELGELQGLQSRYQEADIFAAVKRLVERGQLVHHGMELKRPPVEKAEPAKVIPIPAATKADQNKRKKAILKEEGIEAPKPPTV